jgi:hypothetical protein
VSASNSRGLVSVVPARTDRDNLVFMSV